MIQTEWLLPWVCILQFIIEFQIQTYELYNKNYMTYFTCSQYKRGAYDLSELFKIMFQIIVKVVEHLTYFHLIFLSVSVKCVYNIVVQLGQSNSKDKVVGYCGTHHD